MTEEAQAAPELNMAAALAALGVSEEEAQRFILPLVVQAAQTIMAPLAATIPAQIEEKATEQIKPLIEAIPQQVQQIAIDQIRPSVDAWNAKIAELSVPPPTPDQETALTVANGTKPAGALGALMNHPKAEQVFEKLLDKVLSPNEPKDPFASIRQAGELMQTFQSVMAPFMVETGVPQHEVIKQLGQVAASGINTGVKAAMSGRAGPVALPLTPEPAAISLNNSNGQSKNGNKSLSDFY